MMNFADMFSLDEALVEDLKRDEGWRKNLYQDSEGLWTIGYGTLLEDGISKEEGEFLLAYRMDKATDELTDRALVVPAIARRRFPRPREHGLQSRNASPAQVREDARGAGGGRVRTGRRRSA